MSQFKKNDIVVAYINWLTEGMRYTVLGVKKYPSGDDLLLIVTNDRRRRYVDAKLFIPVEQALTAEEKELRDKLEQKDF
jgi:hypothetical protein